MSDDVKKLILQKIISVPYISSKELEKLLNKKKLKFDKYLQWASENLQCLGFSLRRIIYDLDNEEFLAVCLDYEDQNASEGLHIKKEAIHMFYNYMNDLMDALLTHKSVFTIEEFNSYVPEGTSENTLKSYLLSLEESGYIVIDGDNVKVGPKTLLEYQAQFEQREFSSVCCSECRSIVVAGYICDVCQRVLHKRCYAKKDKSPTCQSCNVKLKQFGF